MVATDPEPLQRAAHRDLRRADAPAATRSGPASGRSRSSAAACSSTAGLSFRGVALHEDNKTEGFAIDNADRDQELAYVKELGATMIHAHYPLHSYTQEKADELGIMQWSEVPVYAVKTKYLKQTLVRKLAARELESDIEANSNHPSVIVWSIGNELSARPGPLQGDYIQRAAKAAKALDPTRPIGYAVAG